MEKKHKIPRIILATIILSIISIALFIISLTTSLTLVKNTEKYIDEIGLVEYKKEVEEKIDNAEAYYLSLDRNIKLDKRVKNIDTLKSAKYNYTRLALKNAIVSYNRRLVDSVSDEEIKLYVNEAYKVLSKYFSEEEFINIEGYNEFKPLLDIYKEESKEENNNQDKNENNDEDIEIC